MRTMLNPVMMKPTIVKQYGPKIDRVAQDCIGTLRKYRDPSASLNLTTFMQRYILEALGVIILDTRLNVLDLHSANRGVELWTVMSRVFDLTYELDILPSLWKYVTTPKLRELLRAVNRRAEYVQSKTKYENPNNARNFSPIRLQSLKL